MNSLAIRIFLSFWLLHLLMLLLILYVLPPLNQERRMSEAVQQFGGIAATVAEKEGAMACSAFLSGLRARTAMKTALYDDRGSLLCQSDPVAGPYPVITRIAGSAGRSYRMAAAMLPGEKPFVLRPTGPPDVFYALLIVSGIACFPIAWYVAAPVRRVRDAAHKFAAGDLHARAGSRHVRNDEMGQLVRDFDSMADRIESLMEAQAQLLTDISHELRSPLARLRVALELARQKTDGTAEADLARIELEAQRMDRLIGSLLSLSRAEHKQASVPVADVKIADVVTSVAEDARYEASSRNKGIELTKQAAPVLHGDHELLTRAFENIVRNALRYTREGSAIEIVVSATNGTATVAVRDHGPGVPEADLDRIFAPFQRVGLSRMMESDGIGLGLAIARRAVSVHGGSITATNVSDGGLCVTVALPMA